MQRLEKLILAGVLFVGFLAKAQENQIILEEIDIVAPKVASAKTYSAPDITIDVLHTDLELQLNWQKHAIEGKADIYLKPYFYAIDTAVLDAKGFHIHDVARFDGAVKKQLAYTYNGKQIRIGLDKHVKKDEVIHLFIAYTALPDSLEREGGRAITDAKGFYFIDSSATRMQQFWTQGEPESNSAWFPTVDKPHEKMTHRIGITVKNDWLTLSNGELEFRTDNGDGTRTDYWRMTQPHAPYLVMLGGGKFDTVGTRWQDKPVRYFVEPEWKSAAQRIFGNTPSMITYFSGKLGVPYPWPKYDQIVVRDYVSGAMENTTATVHGDFLYTTPRAFADDTHEDVIAHELFHQWFGDLVTCEDWGQLPLNESFATYGEIIWKEWKYGPDEATWALRNDLRAYLNEFRYGKAEKMIRENVTDPLEMFDSHSYAKGSRILHMLRHTVGDDAFFASLQRYLTDNAYQAAEISDLRKAFEKTTGRDLRWFFDQWFMNAGHPQLTITPSWDAEARMAQLKVTQTQDLTRYPVYRLPVKIAVYTQSGKQEHWVEVSAQEQVFSFPLDAAPNLIKFDAENYLLAEITVKQSDKEWLSQLGKSALPLDRFLAAEQLLENRNVNLRSTIAGIAMDDKFWAIRWLGLNSAETWDENGRKKLESTVKKLLADENPRVRAMAIEVWSEIYNKNDVDTYRKNLAYISQQVNEAALLALARFEPEAAVRLAQDSLSANGGTWQDAALITIARHGNVEQLMQTDAFAMQEGGITAIYWYAYLGSYFVRGGAAGMAMVDLLAERARDASAGNVQYYAYRFLVENTDRIPEVTPSASPEAAKNRKAIRDYAQQKVDALKAAQ